jgi:hypothetical protein
MSGALIATFMNQRSSGWLALIRSSTSSFSVQYNGIKVDSSGNLFLFGQLNTSIDFSIIKYNNLGVLQWQQSLGGAGNDFSFDIALDNSGNAYVVGTAASTLQVAKYDASGVIQWQKSLVGSASGSGVAVDSSNNVYVAGSAANNIQIAKYNSSGVLQWQRQLGGSPTESGRGIACDSSGNIYVLGVSGSTIFQLAKYDSAGTILWQRGLTSPFNATPRFLALDSSGNVYLAGSAIVQISPNHGNDIFLAKYDSSGTIQWQKRLFSTGTDLGQNIAVDSSNNVYVCGSQTPSGSPTITSAIVAKYDSSGNLQWQRRVTPLSSVSATAIRAFGIAANSGFIYICGNASIVSSTFGAGMVGKFPADGGGLANITVETESYTYAAASLTDAVTSLTDASTTLADTASALTDTVSTLTDAPTTLTSTTTIF